MENHKLKRFDQLNEDAFIIHESDDADSIGHKLNLLHVKKNFQKEAMQSEFTLALFGLISALHLIIFSAFNLSSPSNVDAIIIGALMAITIIAYVLYKKQIYKEFSNALAMYESSAMSYTGISNNKTHSAKRF